MQMMTKEVWYKIGFWFLSLFLMGFIAGMVFADKLIIEKRLEDSIKLKGIVINKIPYDLKERL
jgi:hypothetical protein